MFCSLSTLWFSFFLRLLCVTMFLELLQKIEGSGILSTDMSLILRLHSTFLFYIHTLVHGNIERISHNEILRTTALTSSKKNSFAASCLHFQTLHNSIYKIRKVSGKDV